MSAKNETEVTIGQKTYTLSGYESEEYLQKVAAYINGKMSDFKKSDFYRRQTLDMQAAMIELNIADDYFKAKKTADGLEADMDAKDKEIYDLKHELISAQIKLDSAKQEIDKLKAEIGENQKTIVRLETELDNIK
ncbi:MAG: cell division protein ZapA [Butyrivibrio sp.]|nr:cell division protein ZapA [Butyrivibrio sp.]